jgi:hypothetical protein
VSRYTDWILNKLAEWAPVPSVLLSCCLWCGIRCEKSKA